MRNTRVRFQIDIYTVENDPLAVWRRHRRADALQFHHVLECEWMLLRWRLREHRAGEQKECCEKTFHKRPSFRLTPTGASSVLGSARLWRVGDRILRSRTFELFHKFALCIESDKVRRRRIRRPARYKHALPRTSPLDPSVMRIIIHDGKNRNNQERPLHRDGRSGIDR